MASEAFSLDWKFSGHIVTMLTLTFLMCGLCIYYSYSLKKATSYQKIPTVAFLMFIAIQWIKKNTYQIVGKSYKVAVPFFIYIISLFWFSNIISILGFDSLGNTLVVPASLALVVFLGTIISGLVHRGYRFFGDYVVWLRIKGQKIFPIVDPLKFVGEISKILSLTFRLWGNTLAGSLILFVVMSFTEGLFKQGGIEYMGPILIPLFVFPLHIYFDVIDGTIQPLIFMVLTMCYWAMARHGEGSSDKNYDVQPEVFID
ncbi:FoF1 ATP synthase subunit A [Candidatus Mycoplasma haematohominis]|uniref:FoF1 ATP synthase subunit A n=1 Tax=Candidatus Mycoplasma haematohominis TaxID=1494318 RepID=UPI001C0A77C6|nr:FoF1 ATP synthase subunit a [Candidatus Mycoplasma haemohominis]